MTDKEKLKEIKKLADAMYYAAFNLTTDASLLRKAMDDYHQFIINEYHKEEPVSEDLVSVAEAYAKKHSVLLGFDCDSEPIETGGDIKKAVIYGAQWQKEHLWKPSEEMLEALYKVIPENVMAISEDEMLLDKLYQGLKYGKVLSEK